MKFLAIEPFFFADQYWPASPEEPLAFEYPKGYGPNVKWYPLDAEADATLQEVQKVIRDYGAMIVCHRIPRNIKQYPIVHLPTPERADPDLVHPALLDINAPKDPETFTMSEVQAQSKPQVPKQHRPSDAEPPRR